MNRPKLRTVFLDLTNKCNLRCKMCIWRSRPETGVISRSLFESCVDQLADMELEALNLEYAGESLLHPEFSDFLRYAISKRDQGRIKSVGWTDNGMLFNQKIADLVVSLKVDWINFSLEGVGEVNDNIRLGSKYSVIEKNIKYLLEKRGSSTKPAILLNIVDHGKTENQKIEFYKEWSPVVDEIELLPSIRPDNTWENKNILPENIRLAPSPSFCPIPFETMVIWWDGKVAGCCFDPNLKMVLGDATKEPLKQIWEGDRFQQFRKAVLTNNFSAGSPCYKCEFWKVNFAPKDELILNGKATIQYGYIYRKIRKKSQK
jgi:radical SAM protein with 4Fe4S-binding SPASM domain